MNGKFKFNRNICIVEDVGNIIQLLVDRFRLEGFCVEGFCNTKTFIENFYPNKYGGIIIDINLEKEGYGFNLIEFIRKTDEKTTIIAYSGEYAYLNDERLKLYNVSHFLLKPFSLDELVEKTQSSMEFNFMYYSNLEELDFIKTKYLELLCEF
jgi:DNA-binding NtrC family response regulator